MCYFNTLMKCELLKEQANMDLEKIDQMCTFKTVIKSALLKE